jgi:cleavage and polyadenylation specificity factor subunit 2
MGRIAATEDVQGIRDEEEVGDESENKTEGDESGDMGEGNGSKETPKTMGKYVATLNEVHDAFNSVNTLRYSQPTHLQGIIYAFYAYSTFSLRLKGNAKA